MSTPPPSWLAYVGCRTTAERNAQGRGLAVHGVDAEGHWRLLQLLPGLPNPSYLCLHPTQPVLYAVHGDYSEISSFAIDGNGLLEKVAEQKTWGVNPVHLALTPCLRWLLVANYASGNVASMRVADDGALGHVAYMQNLRGGRGPHAQQDGSHPHQICFSPDGRYAFVPDKGLDTVFAVAVNQATGFLSIAASTPMPRGCGPRHMVFHPRQPLAYIVGELDRTVTTARYDAASGGLTAISSRSTVPEEVVEGSAAGIVLSQDATRLFVSNRGHDSVVQFPVAADGALGAATWVAAGKTPRFIAQFPDGGPLLVAREDGHSIATLRDAPLAFTDLAQTGSPVCIVFKQGNPTAAAGPSVVHFQHRRTEMTDTDTRKAAVLRPSTIKSHDRGGGASTIPLVGPSVGAQAFINGITSFAPGTKIPFHSHNCEESVMLLEGDAMLDIDGQDSVRLQPLDTTWLPANLPHRFRNLSDTQPMKILWIYARLDATRTLTETGVTNFVSAEHVGG